VACVAIFHLPMKSWDLKVKHSNLSICTIFRLARGYSVVSGIFISYSESPGFGSFPQTFLPIVPWLNKCLVNVAKFIYGRNK
jgi:hypothetical protein